MKLTFLGANRQVSGSRYCLEAAGTRLMIDCGMVQERAYLDRNWEECPVPAGHVTAMLLTHAHIDHCGLIPRFVREGYKGPVYATHASVDLVDIMLRDAAKIQEEDAAYKKRRHEKEGRRGRHPDVPLYTAQDVEQALPLLEPVTYQKPISVGDVFTVTFHDAGHILGSAILEIVARENGTTRRFLFSGDIGQWNRPLLRDPTVFEMADYVVMESTYGDRDHIDGGDISQQLGTVINRTVKRRGRVVIPTFAMDRAQQLMFHISRLAHRDEIPDVPIFVDSPMAVDVTEVYDRHRNCMDDDALRLLNSKQPPLQFPGLRMVRTVEESRAINEMESSCIVMSTAGMCNAGRIKHHLRRTIGDSKNTILFVGYQADGTLGRQILEKRPVVRIHGRDYKVEADVAQIHGFSGHADRTDLMRWLGNLKQAPRQVFLTHGEEKASVALEEHIKQSLEWPVSIPSYGDEVELT